MKYINLTIAGLREIKKACDSALGKGEYILDAAFSEAEEQLDNALSSGDENFMYSFSDKVCRTHTVALYPNEHFDIIDLGEENDH